MSKIFLWRETGGEFIVPSRAYRNSISSSVIRVGQIIKCSDWCNPIYWVWLSTRNFIFCLWEHPSKMVISFLGSLPHRVYDLQPQRVKNRLVLRATTFVRFTYTLPDFNGCPDYKSASFWDIQGLRAVWQSEHKPLETDKSKHQSYLMVAPAIILNDQIILFSSLAFFCPQLISKR